MYLQAGGLLGAALSEGQLAGSCRQQQRQRRGSQLQRLEGPASRRRALAAGTLLGCLPALTRHWRASERTFTAILPACMPLKIADQLCRLGVLGGQAEQDENCHCRCRQCCCCYPPSMALSELLLCCRTLLRIILRATVPSAITSYYVTSRRSGWRCRGGSDDG